MKTAAWQFHLQTLAAGEIAAYGDAAFIKQSDGKTYKGVSGTGYVFIGTFAENVDASSAGPLGSVDQDVNVDFMKERTILWRANAGDITTANRGSQAYFTDAATVTAVSSGHTKAGLILAVDATFGVAFAVDSFTSEV